MTAREFFDEELRGLQDQLSELCHFAQRALDRALEAFETQDIQASQEIIDDDDKADLLYEEIIDNAIMIITKQQPVATDLRKIIMTIRIATDFERVADFAVNIAKSTIRLGKRTDPSMIGVLTNLHRMYEISNQMLIEGLNAFKEEDVKLAKIVAEMDDEVDRLYGETIKELFNIHQKNPDHINYVTQLLFICRYLERTADHITNVAENTVYLVKGKHIDLNE
ncbi:phosphate signaling complex protein PhoU [Fervidibacillus halotolerans]|uniref:Phosphate-specific transport system accessory protein PhoU n=1 Tax=Fervidibacillus halotolerans TaxID=2980027 RepID=A0A9E8RZY1_9BACI|nr:phosphate signaling complex protein PhoU [Fervidibacillus halotolerans]WAA12092.1 phosphate signaling complex protein PhoU [Fervidibacillus halotolerans]